MLKDHPCIEIKTVSCTTVEYPYCIGYIGPFYIDGGVAVGSIVVFISVVIGILIVWKIKKYAKQLTISYL